MTNKRPGVWKVQLSVGASSGRNIDLAKGTELKMRRFFEHCRVPGVIFLKNPNYLARGVKTDPQFKAHDASVVF